MPENLKSEISYDVDYKEWNNESFLISERIHDEVLSLPISSVQTLEDTVKVVEVVNEFN